MKKFWGLLAWTGVAVAAVSLIIWATSDSRHEHVVNVTNTISPYPTTTGAASSSSYEVKEAVIESHLGVREMYFALHRDLCCLGGLLAGGFLFAVGSVRRHSYRSARPDTQVGISKDGIPER
jgi:hypothetical protein